MSIRTLALGAVALATLILGSASAMAVTLTSISNNGITCKRHDGGAYPENGHYFECSGSSLDTAVLNRIKNMDIAYPPILAKLSTGNGSPTTPVNFFVFGDSSSELKYFTVGSMPTTAQLQAAYTANQTRIAKSTTDAVVPMQVTVFANTAAAGASYPTTTANLLADGEQASLHESGHVFDFLSKVGGVKPSSSAEFDRVVNIDITFCINNAVNPDCNIRRNTLYPYWLLKDGVKDWAELFAEEVANKQMPNQIAVDPTIQVYYLCSKQFTQFMMVHGVAPRAGTTDYATTRCR